MNSRLHSSIERLEARIAPAGLVKISAAGGSVKITGDDLANDIRITPTGTGFLRIVGTGTALQFGDATGGSFDVPFSKDLTVSLGEGADAVQLAEGDYFGNVTLDGGADGNSFQLGAVFIPGSLKILAKAGDDTLDISAPGADFEVGRDFLVKLGADTVFSTLTAQRLLVGGKFTLTGGDAVEDFSWGVTDLRVGGDVTLASGRNLDRIALSASGDIEIGGKLTIKGGDSFAGPPVPAIVSASYGLAAGGDLTVRGAVSVATVNGLANTTLGGSETTTFARGASIKTGKGDNTLTLQGTRLVILGKLSVSAAGPLDFTMQPDDLLLVGDFTFKGSPFADSFQVDTGGVITGKLTVDLGDGTGQTLDLAGRPGDLLHVLGDVTLKQGAKTGATTTIVTHLDAARKFTIATGAAADTLTLDNLTVLGATSIATGAGADLLLFETTGVTGPSTFSSAFKVLMGDGDDEVTMGVPADANNRLILDLLNLIPDPGVEGTLDLGPGQDTFSGFTNRGNIGNLQVLNLEI